MFQEGSLKNSLNTLEERSSKALSTFPWYKVGVCFLVLCVCLFPVLQVSWDFSNPPRVLVLDDRQGLTYAVKKKTFRGTRCVFHSEGLQENASFVPNDEVSNQAKGLGSMLSFWERMRGPPQ